MPETARNILSSFLNRIHFHTHFNILSSHLAAFFSTQFNTSLSPFRASILYFMRIRFINSFNQTIALTIPVLLNFLQLKKNDPFSTHPRAMRLAVSATVLFYLAYTALLRFPMRRRSAVIADHFLLSTGNAAVASLASVLLPDSLSPFVFAVFGLLSATELMYWLYDEEFDIGRMWVSIFLDNMWTAFSNFTGQPLPLLPL
ncbi:hypothetical protein ACS0TY_025873 [Phlomoides rotata]